MISREEAIELIKKYIKTVNLVKHSIAVEAILENLAKKLDKDTELWAMTGLLHDLDYEFTKNNPEKHANITVEILDGLIPKKGIDAIKAHNYQYTMHVPETSLDKALIAADAVSGLIIAAALVMPNKKLSEVRIKTLQQKFKDKSFASGCNRKRIELCADFGLELDEFLEISLNSLNDISEQLDL